MSGKLTARITVQLLQGTNLANVLYRNCSYGTVTVSYPKSPAKKKRNMNFAVRESEMLT